MVGKIILTVTSFVLFVYILLFKMIKKNDTTYIAILAMQSVGILINLLQITSGIFTNIVFTVIMYALCIVTPILIFMLEFKKINVSECITISIAKICIWLNKPKRAKKYILDTLDKYKDSYYGHKMLAQIYEKEGGMRKAIDEYVKVLDINKKDYKAYYKISTLLIELGQKDEAIEMLNNLLSAKADIYEATALLGELYLEKEKYKDVIKVYTKSLKYCQDKYEIYYELGISYAMINDFETARKCLEKSIELNEDLYKAYYKLGQIALLYRDFDIAEANFSKSLYNEKEAKSYIELAKINMIKNRKEKAILHLNNALKVDSKCYNYIKEEPMFYAIRSQLEKPQKEIKCEYEETEIEKKIEDYLNNTYELTQVLNKQKEREHKRQ